jgi:sec-independent protein translocase protein TatC
MYFLLPHFRELRYRIFLCLGVFTINALVCYYFSDIVLNIISQNIISQNTSKLIYTKLSEAFTSHIKISVFCGLLLSCPFFLLQIWKFVSLGLLQKEKVIFKYFLIISPLLFSLGCLFAYKFIIPSVTQFFLEFKTQTLVPYIKISEYISYIVQNLVSFGIGFQFPLIIFLLHKAGLFSLEKIQTSRKYILIGILIIGCIITPPDILSPIIFTIPIYILYEICILFIKISYHKEDQILKGIKKSKK